MTRCGDLINSVSRQRIFVGPRFFCGVNTSIGRGRTKVGSTIANQATEARGTGCFVGHSSVRNQASEGMSTATHRNLHPRPFRGGTATRVRNFSLIPFLKRGCHGPRQTSSKPVPRRDQIRHRRSRGAYPFAVSRISGRQARRLAGRSHGVAGASAGAPAFAQERCEKSLLSKSAAWPEHRSHALDPTGQIRLFAKLKLKNCAKISGGP
jgi:hypothetical protein